MNAEILSVQRQGGGGNGQSQMGILDSWFCLPLSSVLSLPRVRDGKRKTGVLPRLMALVYRRRPVILNWRLESRQHRQAGKPALQGFGGGNNL